MTALAHKQDVPVARAIWIETPCEACLGFGIVDEFDSGGGFQEADCQCCSGSGYHDETLDCAICEAPVDGSGWCAGCEEYAPGYGQQVAA